MKKKKKSAKLEKSGLRLTDTQEFLNLSKEEMAIIDLKINLIQTLKEIRKANGVTQSELARLIHSSQSRVAMLEGGASDVSLELICRALFALGVSNKGLGKAIAGA